MRLPHPPAAYRQRGVNGAASTPSFYTVMEVLVNSGNKPRCLQCKHFRNSPQYLESVYKGLATLSSAHGSVRSEDGICVPKDLYIAANRHCDSFKLRDRPDA